MCIYLRLFFGMGIIWYFELLAFALAPYNLNPNVFVLTDTLNMLQVDNLRFPNKLTSRVFGCLSSLSARGTSGSKSSISGFSSEVGLNVAMK